MACYQRVWGEISHLPGALWEATAARTFHSYLKLLRFPAKVVQIAKLCRIKKEEMNKTSHREQSLSSVCDAHWAEEAEVWLLPPCKGLTPGCHDALYSHYPAVLTTFLNCLCYREEAVKDTSREGVLNKLSH